MTQHNPQLNLTFCTLTNRVNMTQQKVRMVEALVLFELLSHFFESVGCIVYYNILIL